MKQLKLNLGSGGRLLPGYVNVDNMDTHYQVPVNGADILHANVFDLRTYYPTGTVDEIHASHFFEHLAAHEIFDMVYLCWDLLKPGGKLVVTVPHFEGIIMHGMADYSDLLTRLDQFHALIFGAEKETFHKSWWNEDLGKWYLTRDQFFAVTEYVEDGAELKFQSTVIKIIED
jgi:predicted SAM-dependent methyltransferase